MIQTKSLLVLILASICLFKFCTADCGPWDPIAMEDLEQPHPDDEFEIIYLVAPLLACSYGDDFSYLNAYHGGIAFRNRRSLYSFTINFDASPTFEGALVPNITYYDNGTKTMTWENYGAVFIYEDVNYTYWDALSQPVGVINAKQLNLWMVKWLSEANETFPYYNIWSVYNNWPGPELLPNFECFEFVWQCFKSIQQVGGYIFPEAIKQPQSILALYSHKAPQEVDVSDPDQWEAVVAFYATIEQKIREEGVLTFFEELWDILIDGYFYVRRNDKYYFINLCCFPYFGVHYTPMMIPLPNTTIPPISTTGTTGHLPITTGVLPTPPPSPIPTSRPTVVPTPEPTTPAPTKQPTTSVVPSTIAPTTPNPTDSLTTGESRSDGSRLYNNNNVFVFLVICFLVSFMLML